MTDASKSMRKSKKAEQPAEILELNKETIWDLAEQEAEAAEGGGALRGGMGGGDTDVPTVSINIRCN